MKKKQQCIFCCCITHNILISYYQSSYIMCFINTGNLAHLINIQWQISEGKRLVDRPPWGCCRHYALLLTYNLIIILIQFTPLLL